MLTRLRPLITAPTFAEDEEKTRVARLLNVVLITVMALLMLFSVPALLTTDSDNSDLSGDLHELIANSFIFLVVLHVLASLYHHHIVKDITLKRMLGINTTNKETQI